MDSQAPNNPNPENVGTPKSGDSVSQLQAKITNIIDRGIQNQDPRTLHLLNGEIETPEQLVKQLPKWLQIFNNWRRRYMSDYVFLAWLAVVVGLLSGFAAHIFNRMITISSEIFMTHIVNGRVNWWLFLLPIGGIVLAGIYTRYIIRTDLTHGVTRMMHSLYMGKFLFKRNLIYSPIIGSTITLGLGGSAGSEGPIAISGAAIGSNIGRWLQLKMPLVKVLVGCGAAAGISGIFQSPVGGVLFTLEFLKMEIGTFSILAVVLSSLVAYGIVFVCNGCHVPTEFFPADSLDPNQYWAVLLLGLFCGAYSMYYSGVINYTDNIFSKISNPWLRNVLGGLGVGICIMLFPSLYGVGYPVMSEIIHDRFTALTHGDVLIGLNIGKWGVILVAFLVLAIKCWACGACNASGGVSSDFAPTLFAGAVAGFLFSYFCDNIIGLHLPIPAFILLGMAAVMAGCIEAPMMSIFIVMNMGTDLAFLLAITLSAYTSYTTVRVLSHIRGYDNMLVKHLQWFRTHQPHQGQPTSAITNL